jgi:hypothetical protein
MTPAQKAALEAHLRETAERATYGHIPVDARLTDVILRLCASGIDSFFGTDGTLRKGNVDARLCEVMRDAAHLFVETPADGEDAEQEPAVDPVTDQWAGLGKERFLQLSPEARLAHAHRRDVALAERKAKRTQQFGDEAYRKARAKFSDAEWESLSVEHRLQILNTAALESR